MKPTRLALWVIAVVAVVLLAYVAAYIPYKASLHPAPLPGGSEVIIIGTTTTSDALLGGFFIPIMKLDSVVTGQAFAWDTDNSPWSGQPWKGTLY
jgi:hypothetical protein